MKDKDKIKHAEHIQTLTKEDLKVYLAMCEDLGQLKEELSETIKTIKARLDGHSKEVDFVNCDGETVKIDELKLWNAEITAVHGFSKEGLEWLKGSYPDLFKNIKDQQEVARVIKQTEMVIFGFDSQHLTLSKFVHVARQLIKLELNK